MSENAGDDKKYLLEVIACTVEDALEAEAGGAGRLEIISRFDIGGLTPRFELVRGIRTAVAIPIRVMLRENGGYAVASNDEKIGLIETARRLADSGAEGVVLGFLKSDNEIDLDLMAEILAACRSLRATFHHAFEDSVDKQKSINEIKSISQIDRILSHAGTGAWAEKCDIAQSYAIAARPDIEILAGGGIDQSAIQLLRQQTSISEFHVGTAARTGGRVDRAKVKALVRAMEEKSW